MKHFRIIRIAISFLITLSIIFIFSDFYRIIPSWFTEALLYFQFIPSVLSFTSDLSVAAAGFIIILILTLLFGRLYCSFICPLGFSQDCFIFMGKKIKSGMGRGFSDPHYIIFYTILSLLIVSFLLSGSYLLVWLDPFSIFGRLITYTVSPTFIKINNSLAALLIKKNIFSVHVIEINKSVAGVIFSLSLFSFIIILSMIKGRLYCNMICPVGAILSIVSRFSMFRISINKESCISCGKCEKICKSECIDFKKRYVDNARCVSCFSCISSCPNGSINFLHRSVIENKNKKLSDKKQAGQGTITRLSFLAGIFLMPQILKAEKKTDIVLYYQDSLKQKQYKRKSFSSPPGSQSIGIFNSRCTACSLCISACPTSVLQPAVMQYGLHGIMQPFMDFNRGFCNYECTVCGDICPTDAIIKNSIDAKRTIQTGRSVFIIENCVIYTNGTDCGACSEHCPTKAVQMVPYKNRLVIPEVNTEICTGCGACEYACPVRPLRAIYVEGNIKHTKAKLPKIEKKEIIPQSGFPF